MSHELSRREVVKLTGATLAGAAFSAAVTGTAAAATGVDMGSLANLRGKTIQCYCHARYGSSVLADCRFELQGGRLFVIGSSVSRSASNSGTDRLMSGLAWDAIDEYLVFSSVQDYMERTAPPEDDEIPF